MTKKGRASKRAVADVPIFLDNRLWDQLAFAVERMGCWNYKVNEELLHLRDKAILCTLILTGCRVSEIALLRKMQFRISNNCIVLANVKTLKRGLMRSKIIMPLQGRLKDFTRILADWLKLVPSDDAYVFPRCDAYGSFMWYRSLGRKRIHWLIYKNTGLFPHWFRGVCETIYARLVFKRDVWKLKEFMGLKRLDSTVPYVGGSWEEDANNIFNL